MSSACPKCGAERSTALPGMYKCGTDTLGRKDGLWCRGRAEAIAELDAKIPILTSALSKIADCTDDAEAADCATDALYKWREVRP